MKTLLSCLILLIGAAWLRAAEPADWRVGGSRVDPHQRACFSVQTATDHYYQLLRSNNPTSEGMVVDMKLGTGVTLELRDNVPVLKKAFFRVKRINRTTPLDLDGDGRNDVQELLNLPTQNPYNPSNPVASTDGAIYVPSEAAFDALSHRDNFPGAENVQEVKFLIMGVDTAKPRLYFLNNNRHIYHYYFARDVLGYTASLSVFNGETYFTNTARKNLAGSLVVHRSYQTPGLSAPGIITMEFWPSDQVGYRFVQMAYDLISRSLPWINNRLAYHAASEPQRLLQRQEAAEYTAAGGLKLHTVSTEQLFGQVRYKLLNPGVSYGRLILQDGSQHASARDIVIFRTLPNDISHLAGIITEVPQTPLSHVNLKAKQNNTPNIYLKAAAAERSVQELLGKWVRFEARGDGYSLTEVTQAEAEAYLDSIRPRTAQIPVRDLTQTTIRQLSQLGFSNARAYGAKTANLAELRKISFSASTTIPNGSGIPFYFYDQFMRHNGFYGTVSAMMQDPNFLESAEGKDQMLETLRFQIRHGAMPTTLATQITNLQNSFPAGTKLRCRSSTNNEDLVGYSGAGLYDSYTHHPEEGNLAKSIRQVWAGLWTLRAFEEREFYRVDHLTTAMGVLVHPNYDDERINGVGVTKNLVDPNWSGYYVNAQLGENLVTNPSPGDTPEEFLIAQLLGPTTWTIQYTSFSNLVPEGTQLLTRTQAENLANQMTRIHNHFSPLYGYPAGFAMELEWKISATGSLVIKQARPWVD